MHFESQVHVLYLCAKCVSVDSLVVFHDRKWKTPDDILKQLQEFGDFGWSYSRTIKTSMQGSGERKTAWLFAAESAPLSAASLCGYCFAPANAAATGPQTTAANTT
jgi:hypothetical protein